MVPTLRSVDNNSECRHFGRRGLTGACTRKRTSDTRCSDGQKHACTHDNGSQHESGVRRLSVGETCVSEPAERPRRFTQLKVEIEYEEQGLSWAKEAHGSLARAGRERLLLCWLPASKAETAFHQIVQPCLAKHLNESANESGESG